MQIDKFIPCLRWARTYNKKTFIDDSMAAIVIATIMIPQSLAYALLAGLPPQLGLYASILPLLIYAFIGSSSALSVGPFAISSIMTATALSVALPAASVEELIAGAIVLALSSGVLLLLFGCLRLGFLNNFLSFPVVTGFISASAVVIATSQLGNLLGIDVEGENLIALLHSVSLQVHNVNLPTLIIGVCAFVFLYFFPKLFIRFAGKMQWPQHISNILAKASPVLAIIISIVLVAQFDLQQQYRIAVIGDIPTGLPTLSLPDFQQWQWTIDTWKKLITSAALISIIGFVSAVSVAQSFAAKRRQYINPNQEAIALGMANLGAGLSGAFPISASLSRSAVSFNAGAKTPAAGALTAIGMILATLFLTPALFYLPIATLAAMILVAVISLIDIAAMKRTFAYSHKDFSALALTAVLTLVMGVEVGLLGGVLLSIAWHLYWSSHPHTAVLGKLPGTEHFRNIKRHETELADNMISFRFDASLYFANARFLESQVNQLIADYPKARHFVLMCSSINDIDVSALESLMTIDQSLRNADMCFHLSEVKGPVLDRLKQSRFIDDMSGNLYVSHFQAWNELANNPIDVT
ncbi:MAG: sulfate permease [Pseudomonadales bacterium]|nr:sulfate permease [Pseudomonadales bacterium]